MRIQSKLWVKNACAIGLAAGFIEPLQSNGLHSVHQFLFNLCRILERGHISEWDRKEFTTKCRDDFYLFATSVVFSYVLSHRDDTEYWREIQNRELPAELFSHDSNGLSKYFYQLFLDKNTRGQFNPQSTATHCMAVGMNWNPIDRHIIKDIFPQSVHSNFSAETTPRRHNWDSIKKNTENIIQQIEKRNKRWNDQVKDFPSPYQYLKDYVHNEPQVNWWENK
jgi:hypothetical protein